MTATEINEHIGLPKQTVHRLCTTLENAGFLTRQGTSKRYHAARRLRDLGTGLLHNSQLHIARHQILSTLAQAVGETVNFAVPKSNGMSYLDRVETDWAFRIQLPVGSHVPFHCTASGKCFLASLPAKTRNSIITSLPLERKTDGTLVTAEALSKEVERVAKQGFSLDNEEFMENMVAIAVPVFDVTDRYVASLSFHGPTQRLTIADAKEKLPILQKAAAALQATLFGED
ncbi:MAG: IclR family transcriptional regulator [Marinovum sp.]|nr:IclR family transcriptional regulator [Marinovum sp.]